MLAHLLIIACAMMGVSRSACSDAWDDASGGKSSYLDLGPDYSVPVHARSIEKGSRVVLVRQDLAKQLGFESSDLNDLAEKILHRFAFTTDRAEEGDRRFFATRYQDYPVQHLQALGNPQGDGRVAWTGEMVRKLPDGSLQYLDVSIKGLGRTPLARATAHKAEYSDGYQSMEKAVRSFIASSALDLNGAEGALDLAVIELPFEKVNPRTGMPEKAALTVRVGTQTRGAHLQYFQDQGTPEQRAKLYEYVVRRDLGLPLNAPVEEPEIRRFVSQYTSTLAKQAAVYMDLGFIHGSLTDGNRTTRGGAIDFETFMALDAFHGDLPYLRNSTKVDRQTMQIGRYLNDIVAYAPAKYRSFLRGDFFTHLSQSFDQEFEDSLTRLWLNRLGLEASEIRLLSPQTRQEFYNATYALTIEKGRSSVQAFADSMYLSEPFLGEMYPAAFETRAILSQALRAADSPPLLRSQRWNRAFVSSRSWATLRPSDVATGWFADIRRAGKGYRGSYSFLTSRFRAAVEKVRDELKSKDVKLDELIARAEKIGANTRPEGLGPAYDRLVKDIQTGRTTLEENNHTAERLIRTLVDRDMPYFAAPSFRQCVIEGLGDRLLR